MITPNDVMVKRQRKVLKYIEKEIINNFRGMNAEVLISLKGCPVEINDDDMVWLVRKLAVSGWEIIDFNLVDNKMVLKGKEIVKEKM